MKYFIDTEFLEGKQDKRFLGIKYGETKPTIDLISIGIVSEDGREYYAISKDFNLYEAWNRYDLKIIGKKDVGMTPIYKKEYWIRENVLKPIFKDLWYEKCHLQNLHCISNDFTFSNFKRLINLYGKTNKQIAEEVEKFCITEQYHDVKIYESHNNYGSHQMVLKKDYPEFYAYYADYDWVGFCWLFGKMIDLPEGFPMYCNDLKQELDNVVYPLHTKQNNFNKLTGAKQNTYEESLYTFKTREGYPKHTNEHNAIADARWNKELYNFLLTL